MTVSVILCTMNGAHYLEKCLESLLGQTSIPDEVLVVDGGSTDDSRVIFERLKTQTSRPQTWRWIDQGGGRGLAQARNLGIGLAHSEIIAFVDVDARAHSDWVARIKDAYSNSELHALGGRGIEVVVKPADRMRSIYFSQSWGENARTDIPFLYGLCSSYRTEVLRELGGFNERFLSSGEDVELGVRLRNAGYQLCYDPKLIVDHGRRDDWKSLNLMVYRWNYYGQLAYLEHGQKYVPPLELWIRLVHSCLLWACKEAPLRIRDTEGWWRRGFHLITATRAIWQAQRDRPL